MFNFTSITHRKGWNYQTDFSGENEHDAVDQFSQYCIGCDVDWGHLFYQVPEVVLDRISKGEVWLILRDSA